MESHTCAYYYVTSPSGSPMSSPSPLPSSAAHSRYQSASDVLVQAPSDLEIQESMPALIEEFMTFESGGNLQLSRQTSVSSLQLSRQTSANEETFHWPRRSTNEAFKSVVSAIASNEAVWREVLRMKEVHSFLREFNPGSCQRTSPRREIMRRNTGRTPTCGCGINISISIRPMLLKIAEALRNKLGSFLEEVNSSSSMCTDDNVVFRLILTVTALILEVALRRLERLSLSFNSPGSVPPTPTPVHGGGEGEN
ncbi:unnamed protein product [Camellia sinensis]